MSVLVTAKVAGNVASFKKALQERGDDFRAVAERAKPAGAVHHRFSVGPDYVVVHDEWESAEQFEKFFADPELQAFIGEVGGDSSVPPEIIIGEPIESPDSF